MHALIQSGNTSYVCRQGDDGTLTIPASVLDNLSAGAGFLSVWRSEVGLHETPTGATGRTVGTTSREIAIIIE